MEKTTQYVTQKHSGLTRAYFKPVDWHMPLPSISDIMNNPDDYIELMYHIAMNHKGLNCFIYKYQLDHNTYPVFIYSLAFCAMNENPSIAYSWQMNKNARRIQKFIRENNIFLEFAEERILQICSDFPNWNSYRANRISEISSLIEQLHEIYEV